MIYMADRSDVTIGEQTQLTWTPRRVMSAAAEKRNATRDGLGVDSVRKTTCRAIIRA